MDGITSLGLADKSVQMEVLRQVLIANSICFATWMCWESETKKTQESQITVKAVSSRYIRRGQRFDDDLDVVDEDCPLPPLGDWQPMKDQRLPRAKICLRAQSFEDGWRLLAGASATIISDTGATGTFGIDLALNEIAEEAIQRPNRQTLEVITILEKALGGAMLIVNSSHRLVGATLQALETAEILTGAPLKRGELVSGPLLARLKITDDEQLAHPCRHEVKFEGRNLRCWIMPLPAKGHRLLFLQPRADQDGGAAATAAGTLSRREQEVLKCLSEGRSNDEIATALSISPNTVKNHLDRVFKKLGVTNRFAAALASIRNV